tara:strand:- start:172 stop:501 length:330 start_codon:yes stop_codon:yes gene_type:complete
MKLNKILIIFIFANIFFLNSCESVKNAVTGKKKSPGDEFLVEKKNPLVLPPEFGELPVPLKEEKMEQEESDEEIEKLIGKISIEENSNDDPENLSDSLEQSILEQINNN